jgi:8-oxo-dGTP pyrophosphatase MutT (NUDIX family)
LTQRTAHLNDHPSQISFPGGRVEDRDENRVATALREAEEEIGLAREPNRHRRPFTRLRNAVGVQDQPGGRLDRAAIRAHARSVRSRIGIRGALSFVLDPSNHQRRSFHFGGRHRHYMAMPYEGRYIWGATAGMLYSLYRQLADDRS